MLNAFISPTKKGRRSDLSLRQASVSRRQTDLIHSTIDRTQLGHGLRVMLNAFIFPIKKGRRSDLSLRQASVSRRQTDLIQSSIDRTQLGELYAQRDTLLPF